MIYIIYGKNCQKEKVKRRRATLPKLRLLTYKNKKHKYKLSDPQKKRILAIEEGINKEKNKTKKSRREQQLQRKQDLMYYVFIVKIRNQKNVVN